MIQFAWLHSLQLLSFGTGVLCIIGRYYAKAFVQYSFIFPQIVSPAKCNVKAIVVIYRRKEKVA